MNFRELEVEKFWSKTANKENIKKDKEEIYRRILTGDYAASLKKDGEYTRFVSQDGISTMTGRGVSTITGKFVDNSEKVPYYINSLKTMFREGTCLLGELYIPGKTSAEVRKIMGCLPAKSIDRQRDVDLRYYIFDVLSIEGVSLMDKTMTDRIKILNGVIAPAFKGNAKIEVAHYAEDPEEIIQLIDYAFENNEEGVVLTLKGSKPTPGKRTAWKTIKIKKEFETSIDAFFTGKSRPCEKNYSGKEISSWDYWLDVRTGEKKVGKFYLDYVRGSTIVPITKFYYLDYPGALEIGVVNAEGEIVSLGYVSSGLNDAMRKDFSTNPEKFVKLPCLIQGMEMTNDGAIRHPKLLRTRESDIKWEDCTFEKIVK